MLNNDNNNNNVYVCPSLPRGFCEWEGRAFEIIEHFQITHEDLIIKSNAIEVDVTGESEENKLMVQEDETFLVQTKVCVLNQKLSIRLRLLGTEEESAKLKYKVEISSNQFGFTNEVCPDGYSPVYNIPNGIEVDFKSIHLMCGSNVVQSLTVKFYVEKSKSTSRSDSLIRKPSFLEIDRGDYIQNYISNDEKPSGSCSEVVEYAEILQQITDEKHLSCSNCAISMIPPIYMCSNFHGVCYNCKDVHCSICGEEITPLRNKDLEEYSKSVEYVCRYQNQGCREKFKYDEIRIHEVKCEFFPYWCSICSYRGKLSGLKGHFKISHPSAKTYETILKIPFPRSSNFVILNEKGVFYCSSTANELYIEWKISYNGPKERCFSCEVQIAKKKTPETGSFFLKRAGNVFRFTIPLDELKRKNLKDKNAILSITTY